MTTWFPVTCPTCGYKMDGHSAVGEEDAVPADGSLSICIACGALAAYQYVLGSLVLRQLTVDENDEALTMPDVVAVRLAMQQARENHPDWPKGPGL